MSEIYTLALCEQAALVLRPNTLYKFEPVEGCAKCQDILDIFEKK